MYYAQRYNISGMVAQDSTLDTIAKPAPVSQRSPTSLGNTTVLSPHGIAYNISIGMMTSRIFRSTNAPASNDGITIKRRNETM